MALCLCLWIVFLFLFSELFEGKLSSKYFGVYFLKIECLCLLESSCPIMIIFVFGDHVTF